MSDLITFFESLAPRFRPDVAGETHAVYRFMVDNTPYCLTVQQGTCEFERKDHPDPDITLRLDESTCRRLMNRELSGTQAFLTGKVRLEGPMKLAMQLPDLFRQ